jgi:hypothetical protein
VEGQEAMGQDLPPEIERLLGQTVGLLQPTVADGAHRPPARGAEHVVRRASLACKAFVGVELGVG